MLLALCVCLAPDLTVAAQYQITYRGVFSLGEEMPIADVVVLAQRTSRGDLLATRLEASSEAYPVVESLYPLRYRMTSWLAAAEGRLVALEKFEKTRRTKHRLYVRDPDDAERMRRFDRLAGEGEHESRQLQQGSWPLRATTPLFDHLGMLVYLRERRLQVGDRFSVPVTDGRDRLAYDIRVESESAVAIAGQAVPAFKLRLDAWESDATGKRQVAHRPAYIWLSRDADRSLLRVDVRHAIGRFRAELQAADTRVDVAQLQPRRHVGDRP